MRTFLCVAALLGVLVAGGAALGQSCGVPVHHGRPVRIGPSVVLPSHYQYSTTFVPKKEVIVKEVINEIPVAFPVLVPAFQYQYVPPCCTPAAGAPAHGAAAAAPPGGQPVATPPPAAPGGAGVGQLDQTQIRALAQLILAELKREQEAAGPDAGPPAVLDPSAPGVGTYPGTQPPAGTLPPPDPSQPVVGSPNLAGLTVLQNKCAACHTGPGSKGRFQMFSAPGQLVNFDRSRAWDSIRENQMPHPSRPDLKMTDPEKDIARRFLLGN